MALYLFLFLLGHAYCCACYRNPISHLFPRCQSGLRSPTKTSSVRAPSFSRDFGQVLRHGTHNKLCYFYGVLHFLVCPFYQFRFSRERLRRVLRKKNICRTTYHLHLHIFTCAHPHSHLYLCSCSHLHIYISAHVHICRTTYHLHLHIFTCAHPHSHLYLCSCSHLHIYISAHVHICTSTSLLIFTSSHHLCSSSHPHIYSSHLHLSLFLTFSLKAGGSAAGPPRNATLCGDRACQTREMQARVRFVFVRRNPLRRLCVSSARSAGESTIWICPAQPSAEIVRVECAKCRRECDLTRSGATLCGDCACRVREMQARVRFGFVRRNPLRRLCVSSARNAGESAI